MRRGQEGAAMSSSTFGEVVARHHRESEHPVRQIDLGEMEQSSLPKSDVVGVGGCGD